MVRQVSGSVAWLLLIAIIVVSGCTPQSVQQLLGEDHKTDLVPPNAENAKPAAATAGPNTSSYASAETATCMRVDCLGHKILDANPQAGLRPLFATIRGPQVEVFHKGAGELYITEGLVKKCASEAQLAAILCRELARMVAEREALASAETRNPDRGPPPEVSFGNAGQIDAADQVRQAEMARLAPRRRRFERPPPPPDPKALAHLYLKNAGYREADLEEASALLEEANNTFQAEKFMKSAPAAPTWRPAR